MYSTVFIHLVFLLGAALAQTPAASGSAASGTVDILTSFTGYAGCSADQTNMLKQAAKDAVTIADAGLDTIRDELLLAIFFPQRDHKQVDFSKEAAIEYFGPEKENYPEQARVFDAMFNAAKAYRGWGLSDWYNDRYVFLSCIDEAASKPCDKGTVNAYFTPDRKYGYPLLVFCPRFFTKVPSLDDAIASIDANKDYQQNAINLQTRATTFMHELLHVNWGSAKECRGLNEGEACRDQWQNIGGTLSKSYRPGAAKLLAKRNITLAATNNDNYAYYAASKFMQKRWKTYPKYPSAWDPNKSRAENFAAQQNEPGYPASLKLSSIDDEDWDDAEDPSDDTPPDNVPNDPLYSSDSYPDWYQPVLSGTSGNVPDVSEPSGNSMTYNGPTPDAVVCETSDGSPEMNDCFHAFGSLKELPTLAVTQLVQGKKGGTWWAGYVHSCALAIYFTDDWTDDCKFTLKDVDDYSTMITEKCSTGNNDKIGGHAPITMGGCSGQVQIMMTGGQPPNGSPPGKVRVKERRNGRDGR